MNCHEFQAQLDLAIDQRRAVSADSGVLRDADAVAHTESCADCSQLYDEYLLIETALVAWKPRRPMVDLSDRVIETARAEGLISSNGFVVHKSVRAGVAVVGRSDGERQCDDQLQSRGSQQLTVDRGERAGAPVGRSVWPTIVTVALVLIAVAIVFRDQPKQIADDKGPPRSVFPDTQSDELNESQDQVADLGHLIADAQSAWLGITRRASHRASGLGVFIPNLNAELGITGSPELHQGVPEESTPDGEGQSAEPSAVERTFDFLFDRTDSSESQTI